MTLVGLAIAPRAARECSLSIDDVWPTKGVKQDPAHASARASRATPDEVRRPKRPLSGLHDPRGSGDQRMASMRRARARGRRAPPPNVRCGSMPWVLDARLWSSMQPREREGAARYADEVRRLNVAVRTP